MLCPVCEYDCPAGEDWCPSCGSYLGLLRRRPRHIAKCANLSVAVGLGLFLALAWKIFFPLYEGWPVGKPAGWFWWEFALASLLLALGLRVRNHLREMRQRSPVPYPEVVEEEEQSRASAGR